MTTDEQIADLVRQGWRVFIECDMDGWFAVGITKSRGIGVEGVSYCDIAALGDALGDAFTAVRARAGLPILPPAAVSAEGAAWAMEGA